MSLTLTAAYGDGHGCHCPCFPGKECKQTVLREWLERDNLRIQESAILNPVSSPVHRLPRPHPGPQGKLLSSITPGSLRGVPLAFPSAPGALLMACWGIREDALPPPRWAPDAQEPFEKLAGFNSKIAQDTCEHSF